MPREAGEKIFKKGKKDGKEGGWGKKGDLGGGGVIKKKKTKDKNETQQTNTTHHKDREVYVRNMI